jgi:Protein of unknown function (DUF2924)/Protein of unknown function (DUF3489)
LTKLTGAQRVILSHATQRNDGGATPHDTMTEKVAQKLAAAMIERGLFREVRARTDMPIWRRDQKGHPFAMIITKHGNAAVTAAGDRQPDAAAARNAPTVAAVGEAAPSPSVQTERSTPRQGSKLAEVIALLSRNQGVGIEELASATGWLSHTTRAALTGLRKRGYAIERVSSEQGGSLGSLRAARRLLRLETMGNASLRRQAATPAAEALEAELERIAALSRDDLRSLWLKTMHQSAPKAFSRDLLARAIAHRSQEQRLGKLSPELRPRLDRLARGGGEPVRHLKVGTVMVREHEGTVHEVIVTPGGFAWREKTYPSLSAIALAITGTSWNGPRFFGLRGEKSGQEASVEAPTIRKDTPRSSTRGSVRSIGAAAAGGAAQSSEAARP